MQSLFGTFQETFEVRCAVSEQQIKQAQALRYQVYCIENQFEAPDQFPEQFEIDHYDQRSAHSLIYHRDTDILAGTTRLVLPKTSGLAAPFPIEEHCGDNLSWEHPMLRNMPRGSTAEISRFAVSKAFKRRIAEAASPSGLSELAVYEDTKKREHMRRLLPLITLGLFSAVVRMSAEHGISHWYAVMEPTLLRLLTRFGIYFTPVGTPVSYHGQRQPAAGVADDILTRIYLERPDVWEIVTDQGRVWPLNERAIPSTRAATN